MSEVIVRNLGSYPVPVTIMRNDEEYEALIMPGKVIVSEDVLVISDHPNIKVQQPAKATTPLAPTQTPTPAPKADKASKADSSSTD